MKSDISQPSPNRFGASTAPPRDVRTADNPTRTEPPLREREPQLQTVQPTRTVAPADPGAVAVVAQLIKAIESEGSRDVPLTISTWHLRNQSRAQSDEFEALETRFASLLDDAGRAHNVSFTADAARPVDYHLSGTAYLVNADGFDQWELYLALKPADRAWTLWQAEAPVRVLRSPRLRSQQIFLLRPDRRR